MSNPPRKPGGGQGPRPGGPPRPGRPQGAPPPGSFRGDQRPARPDQARPDQARADKPRPDKFDPSQARAGQARAGQGRPGQARPDQTRPDKPRFDQARPQTPRSDGPRSDGPRSQPGRSSHSYAGGSRPEQSRPDQPRSGPPRSGTPRSATPHSGPARAQQPRPETPRPPRADAPQPAKRPFSTGVAGPRPPPQAAGTPDTPRGAVWLYGIHAVAAALGNPQRRLRRLILTEEAEANLSAQRQQPWPLTPERSDRARIDLLLGRDAVHQGVALLADPLASPLLATALERPGLVLVLDQVTDPRNIGAVLRSAAAFGVACVITQDRNAPEETGTLAKAASGALEAVPLIRAVNLSRTLVALKAAGLWAVGLEANAAPLSGPALSERRIALVLGAEGAGIRRLVRETCDEMAGLAMPGGMESLNVSAAAAVALYEVTRRG